MTNKEYAEGLRKAADFFEKLPEFEVAYADQFINFVSFNNRDEAAMIMRAAGNCKKEISERLTVIKVELGSLIFQFLFNKESICTRKVVGTKHVEEKKIPETVIPAHDEEIVEWDCTEPILQEAK